MKRWCLIVACASLLPASTLERLTLDEMILKSTEIVRGRVTETTVAARGPMLYTRAKVQVYERWKGPAGAVVEVAIPGGISKGVRQLIAGAPNIQSGTEYMFFLWTGKSGVTQIIGLSQGVLELKLAPSGELTAGREPTTETMLDPKTRQAVADLPPNLSLADLRARVARVLGSAPNGVRE